jgi:hypothetical protein
MSVRRLWSVAMFGTVVLAGSLASASGAVSTHTHTHTHTGW